jgi:hypothetical protein
VTPWLGCEDGQTVVPWVGDSLATEVAAPGRLRLV